MKNYFLRNGFTIIELIVVIAVLAVLAAIVSASVVGFINKSKDSAIREAMNGFLVSSSNYFENHNNNYGGFCNESGSISKRIYDSIGSNIKHCHAEDENWAVCAVFYKDASKAWCIDYTGLKIEIDSGVCDVNFKTCQDIDNGGGNGHGNNK